MGSRPPSSTRWACESPWCSGCCSPRPGSQAPPPSSRSQGSPVVASALLPVHSHVRQGEWGKSLRPLPGVDRTPHVSFEQGPRDPALQPGLGVLGPDLPRLLHPRSLCPNPASHLPDGSRPRVPVGRLATCQQQGGPRCQGEERAVRGPRVHTPLTLGAALRGCGPAVCPPHPAPALRY